MTPKYDPLKKYLVLSDGESLQMAFSEIERIIHRSLPMSARTSDSWWLDKSGKKRHSHAHAWLDAGRQIESVDRSTEIVIFTSVQGQVGVVLTSSATGAEPRLLDGVDYPIKKVALLERSQRMEVPDTIRQAIGRLPDGTYHSRSELVAAVESLTLI